LSDVLHVVGALSSRHDLPPEHHGHAQRREGDGQDDDDQKLVGAGEIRRSDSGNDPGHVLILL
jgi:hypothetical protein